MAMYINTEGLEPIKLPQNAPTYRRDQLRLKRDEYLLRMPDANEKRMMELMFRVITLNFVIEDSNAEIKAVLAKWQNAYPDEMLEDIEDSWKLMNCYAVDGGKNFSHLGKSLDQSYPDGKG